MLSELKGSFLYFLWDKIHTTPVTEHSTQPAGAVVQARSQTLSLSCVCNKIVLARQRCTTMNSYPLLAIWELKGNLH